MIIWENKIIDQFPIPKTSKNLAAIFKTASLKCYNHHAVIIAGYCEAPSQSQRSIFDNHQCNYTKTKYKHYNAGVIDC